MKLKKIENTNEKIENGKKLKLLTYKTINEIKNEKNEEDNNNEDIKIKKKENIESLKKEENKINLSTKDKDKESEKSNSSRRDLLNSLNNLKYNFDNLMEIGVHGNKYLNIKKK